MANINFNKVFIGGRITAEPELKKTNNGASVCKFNVAVNRPSKDNEQTADFFNCTAWNKTAELVGNYFHKGSSILIDGFLQNRSWEQDGVKRYATDIVANSVSFVDSKAEATKNNDSVVNEPPKMVEISTDDAELPF